MADQMQVDLIVKAMAKGFESVNNKFTELKSKLGMVQMAAQTAGAVLGKIYDLGKEGAEIEFTASKFDRLAESIGTTGDVLRNDLADATDGLFSSSAQMKLATDMMALGLADTSDEAVRLSAVSAKLGMDVGELTLALTNQTTRRFDQLGVSTVGFEERLKSLKDSGMDVNNAFTEAFLQQAEAQINNVGSVAETSAGQIMQFESAIKDLADEMKVALSGPTAAATKGMTEQLRVTNALRQAVRKETVTQAEAYEIQMQYANGTATLGGVLSWLSEQMTLNTTQVDKATGSLEYWNGSMWVAVNATGAAAESTDALASANDAAAAAIAKINSATLEKVQADAAAAAVEVSNLAMELMGLDEQGIAKMQISTLQGMMEGANPEDAARIAEEIKNIGINAGLMTEATAAFAEFKPELDAMFDSGKITDYSDAWATAAGYIASDVTPTWGELYDKLEGAGQVIYDTEGKINGVDFAPAVEQANSLLSPLQALFGLPDTKNFTFNIKTNGSIPDVGSGSVYNFGGGSYGSDFASGGSFVIPPGYNNDSFYLGAGNFAQSGETVTVTPAGKTQPAAAPFVFGAREAGLVANAVIQGMQKSGLVS